MADSKTLYRFELRTDEQQAALDGLRPTSGSTAEQFHNDVLHLLFLVSTSNDSAWQKHTMPLEDRNTIHPDLPTVQERVYGLERLAAKVRCLPEEHQRQLVKLGYGNDTEIPFPPLEALQAYAEALVVLAEAEKKRVSSPNFRHSTHQETREIRALVYHVERETGKPNWEKLSVLVRAALQRENYKGYDADWLRKLVRPQRKKRMSPLNPDNSV